MNVSRARESTDAIERMYITMRHFFYRGNIKPSGNSGETLRGLLKKINPEIYGSLNDENKVELKGLEYVLDRLPATVEECAYINLTSEEGFKKTTFEAIIPKKRRRICYRIDAHQMNIELLLGKSEIYDILTHLTFLYNEADKIAKKAYNDGDPSRIWISIEEAATREKALNRKERELILTHISAILGRTLEETYATYQYFKEESNPDRFIKIIYHLGRVAAADLSGQRKRAIYFSAILRERIGHHIYGEKWATHIKKQLKKLKVQDKKLHLISSNMHSVMNMLYAHQATEQKHKKDDLTIYRELSKDADLRNKVKSYALKNGMTFIHDKSGANIDVQIIELSKLNWEKTPFADIEYHKDDVLVVFDYAFGEQAFEVMDELLKPYEGRGGFDMQVASISIMGKAGILEGEKGDIMLPVAHINEGTTDNYPYENQLQLEDFENCGIDCYAGNMLTVLGTSLQNKELLSYFKETSWNAIGLEMEGSHYQKAIQVGSKIRHFIDPNVKLRYAYYASDNPLKTGSTLASGALGLSGVKPTYVITFKILEQILLDSQSEIKTNGRGQKQ